MALVTGGAVASGGFLGFIILREQQTAGTAGGGFTSGAFQTRVLTTKVLDTNSDCTLASNQFTLTAGTYDIDAFAPAWFVADHQARLRNVTGSATIIAGTSEYAPNPAGDASQTSSRVLGRFTVAAAQVLELQHRCSVTKATNGFGVAANFGELEVYSVVRLWRVS